MLVCDHTRPIRRLWHAAHKQSTPLHIYDHGELVESIQSSEGVQQGIPSAGPMFAVSVQTMYEAVLKDLDDVNAVAVLDDFALVGLPESVFCCV